MTTIVIRKDSSGAYKGFTCMGHAGYAKKRLTHQEPDILCAAISAWTIGTINALQELAGEKLSVQAEESTGFLKCDVEGSLQEKSVFLLDAMVFSLENISREYGDQYLQVNFEEV